MEEAVRLLELFLQELQEYCLNKGKIQQWYEGQQVFLKENQERRREELSQEHKELLHKNEEEQRLAQKLKTDNQEWIYTQIANKRDAVQMSIKKNTEICNQIQAAKNWITNPEYFRYEQSYASYGDFFPDITTLADYSRLNFQNMAEVINNKKTATLLNKIKLKLGDDNSLMEYAAFSNLLSKAKYLCGVENEALEKKSKQEITLLNEQMETTELQYAEKLKDAEEKIAKIQRTYVEQLELFDKQCSGEKEDLQGQYQKKQADLQKQVHENLQKKYSPSHLQGIYQKMQEMGEQATHCLDQNHVPVRAALGRLWFNGMECLKDVSVQEILTERYPFMIKGNLLVIPGIYQ
jgi:hypothetical protein